MHEHSIIDLLATHYNNSDIFTPPGLFEAIGNMGEEDQTALFDVLKRSHSKVGTNPTHDEWIAVLDEQLKLWLKDQENKL